MPTWTATEQFWRDQATLTADEKAAFKRAIEKFKQDLPSGRFRKGLRAKRVEGTEGIFEMTWAKKDSRATWEYGEPIVQDEIHVIWRRCGGPKILGRP